MVYYLVYHFYHRAQPIYHQSSNHPPPTNPYAILYLHPSKIFRENLPGPRQQTSRSGEFKKISEHHITTYFKQNRDKKSQPDCLLATSYSLMLTLVIENSALLFPLTHPFLAASKFFSLARLSLVSCGRKKPPDLWEPLGDPQDQAKPFQANEASH